MFAEDRNFGEGQRCEMKVSAFLTIILLIVTQCSCGAKITYPELKNVSEIEVMDLDRVIKKISDPLMVSKVIEFINKHREGWDEPIAGFPDTRVKLYLYRDGQFIGNFGIAETSFSMQRDGRWDSKPATEQEVHELLNLIGIDKALLKSKF